MLVELGHPKLFCSVPKFGNHFEWRAALGNQVDQRYTKPCQLLSFSLDEPPYDVTVSLRTVLAEILNQQFSA
jgi:hypothetical protein